VSAVILPSLQVSATSDSMGRELFKNSVFRELQNPLVREVDYTSLCQLPDCRQLIPIKLATLVSC
jgi:hypothetical protein